MQDSQEETVNLSFKLLTYKSSQSVLSERNKRINLLLSIGLQNTSPSLRVKQVSACCRCCDGTYDIYMVVEVSLCVVKPIPFSII